MFVTWLSLSLFSAVPLSAEPVAPVSGEEFLLIRAERVITRPGDVLENASVLVRDGRITAVGPDLEAPEGARVVEGAVVCAGFFDTWSSLGLENATANVTSTDAATRAVDGLDTYSTEHQRLEALRAGITAVRVQSGGSASFGGIGAVLRNHPELSGGEVVVLADACSAARFGRTASKAGDPFNRIAELDKFASELEAAEKHLESLVEYETELAEWKEAIAEKEAELEKDFKKAKKSRDKKVAEAEEKGKEFKESKYKEDKQPKAPRYDPKKAALGRVVDGELPLIVEVHGYAELRGLLEKTEAFGRLRLVIAGGPALEAFADELVERQIPVLLQPNFARVDKDGGAWGNHLGLAGRLSEAGVQVLLGSGGSATLTRDLPTLVELSIAHGLDREAAFSALTLDAARTFDLADRLGSVEVGKDADLLVLDGEPLAGGTRITHVVLQGDVVVEP